MKINEAHDKVHVFGLLQDKRNQKKTRLRHIEATKQDKPRVQGKTTHRDFGKFWKISRPGPRSWDMPDVSEKSHRCSAFWQRRVVTWNQLI